MEKIFTHWRNPKSDIRIKVTSWVYQEVVRNQYIEHPNSFWLLWNYLRKVGFIAVARKIHSRFSEKSRNNKITGIGIGWVVERPEDSHLNLKQYVLFFAPNQGPKDGVVVVNQSFVEHLSLENSLAYEMPALIDKLPDELLPYRAWSPFSGNMIDVVSVKQSLLKLADYICNNSISKGNTSFEFTEKIIDHQYFDNHLGLSKPTAVLFGLGNYAKTAIIPNINKHIELLRVHEIDPEQFVFFNYKAKISLDTSPEPRNNDKFDAWFIAGFHHSHTDLAISAIEQGSYAVIEKPLATTQQQYNDFTAAVVANPNQSFFLCFHKRYSELHSYLMKDIPCEYGEAVDMHCIVYEIPLPTNHWYNWPNSGSRLISNGCHWLDYFMYINDYSPVVEFRKWNPRGSDFVAQVRLDNGAYLSMSLTDTGSQRLGVRDYIELRAGGVTVSMVDAAIYSAENRNRVFNRNNVNPLNSYARMYREISRAISAGEKGDALKSLRSSELTLLLESSNS